MKYNKIKIGEVFSESQHMVVTDIKPDLLTLKPDRGEEFTVNRMYAENFLTSGEQSETEQVINKTQAAELFTSSPYVVMTVNYQKQTKAADVEKEILEAYETSTPKEFSAAVKKAVKTGLQGTERTIVGYHFGKLDGFGRMNFIDMKLPRLKADYDDRQRLVDPRTINYIILRDVKYIVK